ncbi:hypothetical protein TRVL_10120 [Trypanosoma vivax]|nr:hypothetical protein TRVL_10120 [Trypanosoma vivax]
MPYLPKQFNKQERDDDDDDDDDDDETKPLICKLVVRLRGSFRQKTPRAEARIQQHSFTGTAFSQYADNISKQDVVRGILSAVQFTTQMTSSPREHIRAAAKEAFENRNRC